MVIYISTHDAHLVSISLSDAEISALASAAGDIGGVAKDVIKRIIYQANDSPIFCSARNRPIKHLWPADAICQPFPMACNTCPMALYEE